MRIGDPFNPFRMFTGIFIPTGIVRLTTISPGAKLCYGRLMRFAGKRGVCFPSVKTLAVEIAVTERQTQNYLAELQRERLIRKSVRPGTSDLIEFLWHVALASSEGVKDVSPPRVKNNFTEVIDNSPRECKNLHPKRVNQHHHQDDDDEESHVHPEVLGRLGEKPFIEGVSVHLEVSGGGLDNGSSASEPFDSPEAELIALALSKGQTLTATSLRSIREALELRGVALKRFVESVRPHFQNNITNPSGFLISRARNVRALMEPAESPKPPPKLEDRCAHCWGPKGQGLITDGSAIIPCPVCSTPEFREDFAAKEAKRETRRAELKNRGSP